MKFVLFPLALALPAFRLHQHIAYGSAFGEYYTFGLNAYLTAFALWWAEWTIGVVLWAAALRAAIEAGSLLVVFLRPRQAAAARQGLERLGLAALYLGPPALLLLRIVGSGAPTSSRRCPWHDKAFQESCKGSERPVAHVGGVEPSFSPAAGEIDATRCRPRLVNLPPRRRSLRAMPLDLVLKKRFLSAGTADAVDPEAQSPQSQAVGQGAFHVLIEPFAALDTQFMMRRQRSAISMTPVTPSAAVQPRCRVAPVRHHRMPRETAAHARGDGAGHDQHGSRVHGDGRQRQHQRSRRGDLARRVAGQAQRHERRHQHEPRTVRRGHQEGPQRDARVAGPRHRPRPHRSAQQPIRRSPDEQRPASACTCARSSDRPSATAPATTAIDRAWPIPIGHSARRACAPSPARTPHAAANIQPVAGLAPCRAPKAGHGQPRPEAFHHAS